MDKVEIRGENVPSWNEGQMASNRFERTFQTLRARILSVHGLTGLAWGAFAFAGAALAAVWMDLVWELTSAARIAAVAIASLLWLGLLGYFVGRAIGALRDAALARRLDGAGRTGGEILTGFELQGVGGSVALSQGLAELATLRAEQVATTIPGDLVVPWRPLKRAAVWAAGIGAAVFLGTLAAPRLAATEWLRFVDPFGDHPPYSRTRLVVEPGNTRVRYGDGLDVVVTTEGPPVEDLQLVLRRSTESGGALQDEVLPMFAETEGQWRASLSSVTDPGEYFVRTKEARSHRFQLDLITVPEITAVRFRITPPRYTRDPIYEGELPKNGIVALPGTEVEVTAVSNRPLASGSAAIPGKGGAATLLLKPAAGGETGNEVRESWTISEAGTFAIHVVDREGQQSREPFTGTITLLKDLSPIVRVSNPPGQSLATPSAILPVMVAGEDDYGITRLQLYRSLNDTRPTPLGFPTSDPAARRHEDPTQLPLAEYGLQPGDVIKLFARAEDNDPAGAKGSESPVAVVQIISDEELDRLMLAREGADALMSKYQAAQRRMESLQEQMEALQKQLEKKGADAALTEQEKEQLETLQKQIEQAAQDIRESAKELLPYDLDQALNDELEQLAKELDQAAEEMKQARQGEKPNVAETLQKLEQTKKRLRKTQDEFQEGVTDPLEQFSQIYPLFEDQSRFEELVERQRDLAERLASLKNEEMAEDPKVRARMRELEAEQRKTREDLEDLLNDIESHAKQLPVDADPKIAELAESAQKFVDELRASGAGEAMAGAESELSEFSGQKGHTQAKTAAEILESFLSKCKGNGEKCEGACNSLKFRPGQGSMGNSLQQLLDAAGFKKGNGRKSGPGSGTGGGFSARRDSLSNMGLYGSKMTQGNPQQAKSGQGKQSVAVGGSFRSDDSSTAVSRIDPHGMLKSSGSSEAAIPVRYRKQVERYFEQIAEEAGQKRPETSGSR